MPLPRLKGWRVLLTWAVQSRTVSCVWQTSFARIFSARTSAILNGFSVAFDGEDLALREEDL
jgi:hypothetical protein